MKRVLIFSSILFFLLVSFSFSKTADEWVSDGDQALMNHDTQTAYQCYLNAYNLNNNHQGANFGLSLLTLPHYLIDGGDSEVKNFIQNNGLSVVGNLYDLYFSSWNVEEKSKIPEIQNFIENHILPYISQSLTYSNKISSNFTKTIKKEMQPHEAYRRGTIQVGDYGAFTVEVEKTGAIRKYGELCLPSNIQVGLKWKPSKDCDCFATIESISETVTTPAGTFTNCVKVIIEGSWEWDGEIHTWQETRYYKKDIGLVKIYEIDDYGWYKEELIFYSGNGTGWFPLELNNSWEYEWESEYNGEMYEGTETWVVTSIEEYDGSIYKKDREWDYGDTLAYRGILNFLNGLFNFACAYNLDVDTDDLKNLNIKQLLEKYPNFLTIKSGGQTKLNNALTSFQNLLDCLIGSYDSINNETDTQDNDIVVFPENEDFKLIKNDIRNLLSDLRGTLNPGGKNINLTDYFLKVFLYSKGSPLRVQKIDLSKFFTNPITRTNLEPLQYDENGKLIFSSLWNVDHTLNGVFPDMTKAEFVGYCRGIKPKISVNNFEILDDTRIRLNFYVDDISKISLIKIYRDTTPYVNTSSTLIASIVPTNWNYSVIDNTATSDTYYYRVYLYYKDGSFTSSYPVRATKGIYVDLNRNGLKGTKDEPYKYISEAIENSNIGGSIFISGGEYKLERGLKAGNEDVYIDKPLKLIGSCNSSTWIPNINLTPTILDAYDVWSGIQICASNSSIENFIVKNAIGNGIEIGSSNVTIKNCVVYNTQNYWGIDIWNYLSNINILNCTIANNYGRWGGGIGGSGSNISIKNCIITNNSTGVNFYYSTGLNFSYNDVWGNTTDYSGIFNQTGINGNISEDPIFVDPENGNYRLSESSPCRGKGENGVDIGAFPYISIQKGDINRDNVIDISDVILCLRMAIGLDPVNVNLADMNGDGEVDITDVILILRKAIGLPI